VDAAEHRRDGIHWLNRRRRRALDTAVAGWRRSRDHWRREVERVERELDARPAALEPFACPTSDRPQQKRRRERAIGVER
jgi:hypothetical protein